MPAGEHMQRRALIVAAGGTFTLYGENAVLPGSDAHAELFKHVSKAVDKADLRAARAHGGKRSGIRQPDGLRADIDGGKAAAVRDLFTDGGHAVVLAAFKFNRQVNVPALSLIAESNKPVHCGQQICAQRAVNRLCAEAYHGA